MANLLCVLSLIAALAGIVSAGSTNSKYCTLETCDPGQSTLCRFSPTVINKRNCGVVQSSVLTAGEIRALLDAHNKYRERVRSGAEKRGTPGPQPAASNMKDLKWDDELAKDAQAWANQCDFNHDTCRNVGRFDVGQNIAYRKTTGPYESDLTKMVTSWYNEVALFDNRQVESVYNFDGVGHYTQMVWAETTLLGCAAVRYNSDGKWNTTYLVCNYGPTGNWEGEQMYAPIR